MNTLEIKHYLENSAVTNDAFLNVFALDQLPKEKIQKERWFLVCNCCPADMIGEHWIALFYEERSYLEFFDSFGLPPDAYGKEILSFIAIQGIRVVYNNVRLQTLESDACGHYCLLYTFHRCRGELFQTILEKLNGLKRDNIVKFIVTNLLF